MLVGGAVFQVTRIHGREWGISLALGFVSIPLGAFIRCIPTPPLERIFIKMRIINTYEILPTTRPDASEHNRAINSILDNLSFSHPRGGSVNATSSIPRGRPNFSVHLYQLFCRRWVETVANGSFRPRSKRPAHVVCRFLGRKHLAPQTQSSTALLTIGREPWI